MAGKQDKASTRAKKKEASTLAQQTYNDKRAKRYHVQLVNTNFGKRDFSWTGTYDDDHLPGPGDTKRADLDFSNFIKRLYRWCDKNGVQRPKWVAATEYTTVDEAGKVCGRHHHHAIIQHTEGLDRDVLEDLWRPNDTKWSRKKLEEASTMYIDDAAFWERQYPGYTLNRVETTVNNSGYRHTIVILRRAEWWHGRGGTKKTRRKAP